MLVDTEALICSRCLINMPYTQIRDYKDNLSARLFWGMFNIHHAYSHIYYRHDALSHPLIMALKYGHRPDVGWKMGEYISKQIIENGFFTGIDAIVPVPLHWIRWIKRGYNQSEQLAKGISRATGIPIRKDIVKRKKYTHSQSKRSATERQANVTGVFKANKTSCTHLLLVDDVLTTGATIKAMAQAIQAENPSIIFSILTLCKV